MGIEYYVEQHYGKPIKDILYDLYVVKNLSKREVAKEMHLGTGTIHSWIHKYHITKNKNLW